MKDFPYTNFAFEVDIENRTGRFLFDTHESDQELAEKIMLQRCTYNYVIVGICGGTCNWLKLGSSDVIGVTVEGAILPKGDSFTTQLATEKGFICQIVPAFWEAELSGRKAMYIITDDELIPLRLLNTPFDV